MISIEGLWWGQKSSQLFAFSLGLVTENTRFIVLVSSLRLQYSWSQCVDLDFASLDLETGTVDLLISVSKLFEDILYINHHWVIVLWQMIFLIELLFILKLYCQDNILSGFSWLIGHCQVQVSLFWTLIGIFHKLLPNWKV